QQGLASSDQSLLNHQRAVPDIASSADPNEALAIYITGSGWQPIGGTSAASPLWAGLAAIADQMAGHPLGFLNPKLYKIAASSKYAQDFNDITTGNNNNTDQGVQGYSATTNWDAVTGLGTPNAANLLPDLISA
ncbi:MAG TPA: peptidase S53, partial [Ktedonobacterales bacterium]|nr:peptidase S53 [Ktedonobacterales bacterium]